MINTIPAAADAIFLSLETVDLNSRLSGRGDPGRPPLVDDAVTLLSANDSSKIII